jgi:cell division protein FtsB
LTPNGWLFLGTCVTALATLAGGVFTAWQVRQSQQQSNRVDAAKAEIDAQTADVENLRHIIAELNDHLDRVQQWHDECEQRCAECARAKVELKAENIRLSTRVCVLEGQVAALMEGRSDER